MCKSKPPPSNRGKVGIIRHVPHHNPGELGNVTGRRPLPGEKPWWAFRQAVNHLVARKLGHTGPFFVQDHRDSCRYKRGYLLMNRSKIRVLMYGTAVVGAVTFLGCSHDVVEGEVTEVDHDRQAETCEVTLRGESDYGTEEDTHTGRGRVCDDIQEGDQAELDEGVLEIEYDGD